MAFWKKQRPAPRAETPTARHPIQEAPLPPTSSVETDKAHLAPGTLAEVRRQEQIQLRLLQDARRRGVQDSEFPELLRAAIHEGTIPPLANVIVRKDGGSASMSIITGELPDNALTVTLTASTQRPGEISHAELTVRRPEENEAPYLHEHRIAASLGFERPLTLDEILNTPPPSQ